MGVLRLLSPTAGWFWSWTAPMDCEKLLKPVEKAVDLRGTWYMVAVATESRWVALLLNSFLGPSFSMDITEHQWTSMGGVNTSDALLKIKLDFLRFGMCINETKSVNDILDAQDVYLQTDCPDCVVVKWNESRSIVFMSKRTIVTAAEMTEFEKQVECLGWPKMQVLNTDHGTENCKVISPDLELSENEQEEIVASIGKRLCYTFLDLLGLGLVSSYVPCNLNLF